MSLNSVLPLASTFHKPTTEVNIVESVFEKNYGVFSSIDSVVAMRYCGDTTALLDAASL